MSRIAPVRGLRLQLLVTEEERAMAVELAQARGKTLSDVLRDLVRAEHAATLANAPRVRAM